MHHADDYVRAAAGSRPLNQERTGVRNDRNSFSTNLTGMRSCTMSYFNCLIYLA